MSANVEPVTHDILKSIQSAIAELRVEMRAGFDDLHAQYLKERRNAAGTLVMMRATAGDVDLRVKSLEQRVAALESRA